MPAHSSANANFGNAGALLSERESSQRRRDSLTNEVVAMPNARLSIVVATYA